MSHDPNAAPTTAIVIPARFASTRYPGKPLAPLTGAGGIVRPLIAWTIHAARQVRNAQAVYVATDDDRIADVARAEGVAVLMTPADCANGTVRCAAAAALLGDTHDIIVNFQGDALLTPPHFIAALLDTLARNPAVDVATPAMRTSPAVRRRLLDDQAAGRVGGTTVVIDGRGDALYFSKSVIPHVPAQRIADPDTPIYLHVGAYAYRRGALARYAAMPACRLEELEGLEQLRFLDARMPVRVVTVDSPGHDLWELNNPEDTSVIEQVLATRNAAHG